MTPVSRRTFLERATLSAVAGVMASRGLRANPLGLPLGSQTYPERQQIAAGKFVDLLKGMKAAGIEQIELCSPGYAEFKSLADGKQTRKIIEDAGLKAISAHFSYNEFRDSLGKAIEWAHDVGITQMGTASLPQNMGTQTAPIVVMSGGVTSEESIKRAAETYGKIGAQTKAAGLQLFLHNETFENSRTNDGRLTYPILLSALDPNLVKMQFQMSSMRTIGNPVTYFNLYPGRFISAHVHGVNLTAELPPARGMAMPMKPPPGAADAGRRGGGAGGGRGTAPLGIAIGDDDVNWPAVFAAAKIGGMQNFFIEQEQSNGWECMVKGAAYLRTLS